MADSHATAALLLEVHDFTAVDRDEFDAWCDTEHIPERLALPGFRTAQRWLASGVPNTAAILYDLDGIDALRTEGYLGISGCHLSPWSRRIVGKSASVRLYEAVQRAGSATSPTNANALYLIGMNIDDAIEDEFNAWYDEEHLPRLAALTGVVCARRFEAVEGPHRYFAVYHLDDPSLVGSPAWLEAAETPWTLRLRPRTSDRFRIMFQPVRAEVRGDHVVHGSL